MTNILKMRYAAWGSRAPELEVTPVTEPFLTAQPELDAEIGIEQMMFVQLKDKLEAAFFLDGKWSLDDSFWELAEPDTLDYYQEKLQGTGWSLKYVYTNKGATGQGYIQASRQ